MMCTKPHAATKLTTFEYFQVTLFRFLVSLMTVLVKQISQTNSCKSSNNQNNSTSQSSEIIAFLEFAMSSCKWGKCRNHKFHFHMKKMALNAYDDFLELGMNCLQDYLSGRGLNTTGRKIELVAQAFAAFEMKLPIIASSENNRKS